MITNIGMLEFAAMLGTIAAVGVGAVWTAAVRAERQHRARTVPRPPPIELETPRSEKPCTNTTTHRAGLRCPYCVPGSRKKTAGR